MSETGRPDGVAHHVERCELTELLVDQCGCPQHRGEHRGDNPPDEPPGPWFTANYHGVCSRCDERFEPGLRIRADGYDGWECCRPASEYGRSP